MQTTKKKLYWDSCVFLAWIYDEPNEPSIVEGMEEVVRDVDANRIILITSVVTRSEILESRMTPDIKGKFDSLFSRRNVVMIELDHRISDLSHEIRDYYDQREIKLTTSDCHHIATAIKHRADEFQTLDGAGKKKRGKLLPLNGVIAGRYRLKICKPSPSSQQPSLLTIIKPPKKES